jgi:hypothetical protein
LPDPSIITDKNPDSSVGIVSGYGLDGQGSGVGFPAGARDVSLLHSVQTDPEAHKTSYPMGTGGSFSEGKAARG